MHYQMNFHNPHWPKSVAAPQQLHRKRLIRWMRGNFTVVHGRFSMEQDRMLTWLSMKCWAWTSGTPRSWTTRPFHLLSLSPHPLRPHWHPSPACPPHPPHPLHPPRPLHHPLLQLQSSLWRWVQRRRRQQWALHTSGWLRGKLLRYLASSPWLLSWC